MSEVLNVLDQVTPVYIEFEGWSKTVTDAKTFSEFPKAAQNYIKFLFLFENLLS